MNHVWLSLLRSGLHIIPKSQLLHFSANQLEVRNPGPLIITDANHVALRIVSAILYNETGINELRLYLVEQRLAKIINKIIKSH